MTTHGRIVDRHRFDAAAGLDESARGAILHSLGGYRNADGGFGWGLEPDLRAPESQPAGALHALEAIADAAPATSPYTLPLLDWLQSVTLSDGGVPFALPVADPVACAPFWVEAASDESSLQLTAAVAAQAHRVAMVDEAAREHPWLTIATDYCLQAAAAIREPPFAYVLSFVLQLLDAATDTRPDAAALMERVSQYVPADGAVPVAGGAEGETLHLLDFAPDPDRPVREFLDQCAVEDDLDRLEAGQQPDGGWQVDFTSYSPAAALEWRGYATVRAVSVLRRNGR